MNMVMYLLTFGGSAVISGLACWLHGNRAGWRACDRMWEEETEPAGNLLADVAQPDGWLDDYDYHQHSDDTVRPLASGDWDGPRHGLGWRSRRRRARQRPVLVDPSPALRSPTVEFAALVDRNWPRSERAELDEATQPVSAVRRGH